MNPSGPATFAERVARLHAEFARAGLSLADMRRAQTLELQYAGVPDLGHRPAPRQVGIEPLEGPIEARLVPRRRPHDSRLRYFLDGAQRTLPVWRCGLAPVIATIAAAAVLRRDAEGRCELVPGTLRLEHAWLIPCRLADARLDPLIATIADLGGRVVDTLAGDGDDDHDPADAGAVDYAHLLELAYGAAREVRERLEQDLLARWASERDAEDDGWIVVDGRLRTVVPNAIGLVKQFRDGFLAGVDAETLLNLPPGYRTTAFFPTDRYRGGPDPDARTLWYLRLWDATGLDARHALVRVEASPEVRASTQIDELSAWLLTERTPRATADARWSTLLYPVHYLERILKRRLDADTRGWSRA